MVPRRLRRLRTDLGGWFGGITPFTYGAVGRGPRAHQSMKDAQRSNAAVAFYYADGVLDPVTTRKVVAEFGKPVLLLAGEYDFGLPLRDAAEYGGPFEHAGLAVQPGAGRFPWLAQPCPPSHGCRIMPYL